MSTRRLLHARATAAGSRVIRLRPGRVLRCLILRRFLPRSRLRLPSLFGTGLLLFPTRPLLACAGLLLARLWLLTGLTLLTGTRLHVLLAGSTTNSTRGTLTLPAGLRAWLLASPCTRLSGSLTTLGSGANTRLTGGSALPLLTRRRTRHATGLSTVAKAATGRLRGTGLVRVFTRLLFLPDPLPDRRTGIGLALLIRSGTRTRLPALHSRLTRRPGTRRPVRGGAGAGLHGHGGGGQANQRNQSHGSYCRTHNLLPTDRGTLSACGHQ